LASRAAWAPALFQRLADQAIRAADVPIDVAQRLTQHADPEIQARVAALWPAVLQAVEPANDAELARVIQAIESGTANPYHGQALFAESCGRCHQLFRDGGQIGPNLTPYRRDDTARLVLQIVHPNLEIREGFETWTAVTADGRIVQGFRVDQDPRTIVLRGADGQDVALPRDEVESFERDRRSLMPTGLLQSYSDQQLRDLFAYLRISQPLYEP
jgi:putative heme-binding domain-containing protein